MYIHYKKKEHLLDVCVESCCIVEDFVVHHGDVERCELAWIALNVYVVVTDSSMM